MESVDGLPSAVATLVRELNGTDFEARQSALAAVGRLLEKIVRERLDDELLGASLDGFSSRSIKINADGSVEILGAFYTLASRSGKTTNLILPMQTRLSSNPNDTWTVWVGDADSQCEIPKSEREYQRAFDNATWRHRIELRAG